MNKNDDFEKKIDEVVKKEIDWIANSISSLIKESDWEFFESVLFDVEEKIKKKIMKIYKTNQKFL